MYVLLGTPSSDKIDPKIETMSVPMMVLIHILLSAGSRNSLN